MSYGEEDSGRVNTVIAVVLMLLFIGLVTGAITCDENELPPNPPSPKQLCAAHGGAVDLAGTRYEVFALCADGLSGEVWIP